MFSEHSSIISAGSQIFCLNWKKFNRDVRLTSLLTALQTITAELFQHAFHFNVRQDICFTDCQNATVDGCQVCPGSDHLCS